MDIKRTLMQAKLKADGKVKVPLRLVLKKREKKKEQRQAKIIAEEFRVDVKRNSSSRGEAQHNSKHSCHPTPSDHPHVVLWASYTLPGQTRACLPVLGTNIHFWGLCMGIRIWEGRGKVQPPAEHSFKQRGGWAEPKKQNPKALTTALA